MTKEIYNVDEISTYLQLSTSGIRKLVKQKKIPHFRVGNRIRFNVKNINLWLEELEQNESMKSPFFLVK